MLTKKVLTKIANSQKYELHCSLNANNKLEGEYTAMRIDAEGNRSIYQTGSYKNGQLHGLTTEYYFNNPQHKFAEKYFIEGICQTVYLYVDASPSTDADNHTTWSPAPNQIYEVRQLDASDASAKPKYINRPILSAAELTEEQYNAELSELINNVQSKGRRLKSYTLNTPGQIYMFTK